MVFVDLFTMTLISPKFNIKISIKNVFVFYMAEPREMSTATMKNHR